MCPELKVEVEQTLSVLQVSICADCSKVYSPLLNKSTLKPVHLVCENVLKQELNVLNLIMGSPETPSSVQECQVWVYYLGTCGCKKICLGSKFLVFHAVPGIIYC